jgi:hypothetical protein
LITVRIHQENAMFAKSKQYPRQQFLIDREIQRRISQDLLLTIIVGAVLVYAFPVTVSLLFGLLVSPMPPEEVWQGIMQAVWLPLTTIILLLPLGLRHSIRFSNRVAGPMYRFKTEIRNLLDGKPADPIHLRPKDFFLDYARDFNELATRYQQYESFYQQYLANQPAAGETEQAEGWQAETSAAVASPLPLVSTPDQPASNPGTTAGGPA